MIRLATGRPALFALQLLVALVAFLPMRLALGMAGLAEAGVSAREARGSLWSGRLVDAAAAGLPLGTLDAGVSPLPLLVGIARMRLDGRGDSPAAGTLEMSRRTLGVSDLTASVPVAGLFAPLPVTTLDLDGASVRYRGDACDAADGRVRATLAGEVAGVPLSGTLSGALRCDAGALLLPMRSAAGDRAVALRLRADGRYTADVTIAAGNPALAARLADMGFRQTPAGWRLGVEGRLSRPHA